MASIIIHTDGGCSGNPGPGGWAFVLHHPDGELVGSGGEKNTTNNKMELRAVIEALSKALTFSPAEGEVELVTDSQYVKNGITSWINSWKRNGWKTASKEPVKNRELWEELDRISAQVRPRYSWVKGHAGHEHNERCDALVQVEIAKFR
ncbi:MAG TPA: ribonuclease HI [Rectinemataceae bacterium]|nr:ribonuclease HI [Rectinemataceae bacterium]